MAELRCRKLVGEKEDHPNGEVDTQQQHTANSDSCPEEDEPGSDSTASPDLDPDGDVEDGDGDDDGDTALESEMAQESDTDRIESDAVPESETGVEDKVDTPTHGSEEEENEKEKESVTSPKRRISRSVIFQRVVKVFFGCLAAVTCGMMYAVYLSTYHERKFWFSTRQDVEREMTFQGGSAMYYYYYKYMLSAPSFEKGLYDLLHDNKSVSGETINAVDQLSLYPEVITSLLYRLTRSQDVIEPVYFYIGVVFGLQAVYVTALFISSWIMSGTWVAGMLAVAWYIINRSDTTKVDYAIPLRENWALPYFSCQVAALTGFLSNNISSTAEMFCYLLMSVTTFTFLAVWEHSHYVLFIQALILFLLDCFDLVQPRKMADIHKVYLSSLLLAYLLQNQKDDLLTCPLLSLLTASLLARYFQKNMKMGPLVARVMKILLHFYLVFTTAITSNYVLKKILQVSESDFTLKFLQVKFGLNTTRDFMTNLLLCQEAFLSPTQELFLRLTQASVLPFYLLVLLVCLLSTLHTIYRRLSGEPMRRDLRLEDGRIGEQPEVIYHVFHTLIFGALTMVFEGLKFLWTPYVCVFTAFGVCSPELWMTVFKWLRLRSVHPVVLALILSTAVPTIIGFSLWREYFPRVLSELSELQEFYDSDMVELLNWMRSQVPSAAVFAASPQLLGMVRGSGLTVTSLPLYADFSLFRRSESAYQVYGMRSADEVYKLLSTQKSSYVIVEESLCNELGPVKGCRVKDLMDYANGHLVYDKGEAYTYSKYGRFCHEIKMNYSPYTNYFTRVFWNRSYHVYKVNSVISFQY
ncbi:probable C-mannosyltransferase DPY19L4 [Engraulis encrasicolus]|uniref:probable C-mannosyltransferase DPY19L4 n=1 Tax=Engraulis encrasicolus TaxID=184585 RepID=UPI002FCFB174